MRDVRLLREALPYLRRHRRTTMVIKVGGEVAASSAARKALAQDISLLTHVNIRIVLVHGGGPQASSMSRRLGVEPRMVQGRRVTDEQTLDIAKMVFAGQINVDLLSALRTEGVRAVGLSGVDADILQAERRPPTEMKTDSGETEIVDFGHVGDVREIDTALLSLLGQNGYVPVIASLGSDTEGNILNINADTVATEIAIDLDAHRLISLTAGVPGLLRDPTDPASLIARIDADEADALIESGAISGGMVPKVTTLLRAVRGGVGGAVILSGTAEDALLLELFTDHGVGTLIEAGSAV